MFIKFMHISKKQSFDKNFKKSRSFQFEIQTRIHKRLPIFEKYGIKKEKNGGGGRIYEK